jgi:hypothetical protein
MTLLDDELPGTREALPAATMPMFGSISKPTG